jgi:hypothetical protein
LSDSLELYSHRDHLIKFSLRLPPATINQPT